MDDIYQTFEDADGNFLEQFQSTAFDARLFELYLFTYFERSGYKLDRTHAYPDFLVTRGDKTVAVEATTVNPPTSGAMKELGKTISDLNAVELRDYERHELAIRFGSPLFSKLQKRYWELPHCHNIPIVIAIEAFHDENSLSLSDKSLMSYVYGSEVAASWDADGTLQVSAHGIDDHRLGPKTIPSNFFSQPDAEHIAAIMFTNSGTSAKFSRMGFQHGFGCDEVEITRWGFFFMPDHEAMDPAFFSYNLSSPPLVETWGQGLVVMHNPNCLHPVPEGFFVDSVQARKNGDHVVTEHLSWHPFSSKTQIFGLGETKKELEQVLSLRRPPFTVHPITRQAFERATAFASNGNPLVHEDGWFGDDSGSFLGVVIKDKSDNDWGYVVLARDPYFHFRAIDVASCMTSRAEARETLQLAIARLLCAPKRIFGQD